MLVLLYFSCGIPVVVIGETGCGKTRLLKFLCKLAAQGIKHMNTSDSCIVVLKVRSIEGHINDKNVRFMVVLLEMKL